MARTQPRDKKAVGPVVQRGQPHARAARAPAPSVERRRPSSPDAAARNAVDLPRPLGVEQRADDIDERAARA